MHLRGEWGIGPSGPTPFRPFTFCIASSPILRERRFSPSEAEARHYNRPCRPLAGCPSPRPSGCFHGKMAPFFRRLAPPVGNGIAPIFFNTISGRPLSRGKAKKSICFLGEGATKCSSLFLHKVLRGFWFFGSGMLKCRSSCASKGGHATLKRLACPLARISHQPDRSKARLGANLCVARAVSFRVCVQHCLVGNAPRPLIFAPIRALVGTQRPGLFATSVLQRQAGL